MASTATFAASPPFPDDLSPVADITTISLVQLAAHDRLEQEQMFKACHMDGFFLLYLGDDTVGEGGNAIGTAMVDEVDQILSVVRDVMSLEEEEKMRYESRPPIDVFGYKRTGIIKTSTGQPDRCEFYNIGQDDILANKSPPRPAPSSLASRRYLFQSYVQHGQHVLGLILDALSSQLGLPPNVLRNLQPPSARSGTTLRLIRYQPSLEAAEMRLGLAPHTDFGTVTLLANVLGGLQVLRRGHAGDVEDPDAWAWVRPKPRTLIVNMGDAMVAWTGGILRSAMHRVNYSPGEQRHKERLSVALLIRPRSDASMKRLVGGRIPTIEQDKARRKASEAGVNDDYDGDEFGIGAGDMTAAEWEAQRVISLRGGKNITRSRGGRPLEVA